MKYLIIIFVSAFAAFPPAYAQDPEQPEMSDSTQMSDSVQVSDDELKKYAVAMDSINDMKASLLADINGIVRESKMTNARYNELSRIASDEAALTKAKATAAEKAVLKKVSDKKAEGTEEINTTFQALAKDYVGPESYNKVKKALETDDELKSKYQAMLKELQEDETKSKG